MQYFKHMTGMRNDSKIKRVINKYGIEGYGIYCIIIESIVENITTENPLPELSETCEDLAEFYNGNTAKINEIVNFMINQGLFELNEINGRVICSKVYKFLEQSQTRSEEIKRLIHSFKSVSDKNRLSQTNMIEQEQEQEQEQESRKRFIPPSTNDVSLYIKEKCYSLDPVWFINYYESKNWMVGKNKMSSWKAAISTCEQNNKKWSKESKSKYIAKPTEWPEL